MSAHLSSGTPLFSAAQIRAAEAPMLEQGAGPRLMRMAAAGLAAAIRRTLIAADGQVAGARIAVLAGPGNNGGDALYAGANLARRGAQVTIMLPFERTHTAGLAAARQAGARLAPAPDPVVLAGSRVVIDGIFGTGAKPELPDALSELISAWQAQADPEQLVFAVDAPTGIDASTGAAAPTHVKATHTVTFGGDKTGLHIPPGADACGQIELIDIGLDLPTGPPAYAYPPVDTSAAVLGTPNASHKYTRGVLGILAGSAQYPGAGVLCASAASAAGVGMLRIYGAPATRERITTAVPESVAAAGRVQAWVIGPGAPEVEHLTEALAAAGTTGTPAVIDAGALEHLDPGSVLPTWVLTPHAGEAQALMRRLGLGERTRAQIEADSVDAARALAAHMGCAVLLKGPRTVIAEPIGTLHLPAAGPATLATAGSGDVLAGILGAVLATSHVPTAAAAARCAAAAVTCHNAAGQGVRNARDIIRGLSA